jgi:hypothetical protein
VPFKSNKSTKDPKTGDYTPTLHYLFEKQSEIQYLDSKNDYECPFCNKDVYDTPEDQKPERDWDEPEFVLTEALQRTIMLDIPENLIVNLKRQKIKSRYPSKDHTNVIVSSQLYLD